ncbi:MAG: DUF1553 domain-containing protein [Planctomycetota bacterium]|nr:DUF1553 domain-containing protein [Planctomycetota bacterium]
MIHCRSRRVNFFACFVLWILPGVANATPANRQGLLQYLGRFRSERLDSCAVCHLRAKPDGAESLDEFPHNAFGDRLRLIGEEAAENGPELTIQERLARTAEEDSDGDGVSNLRELLAGTSPGSAKDKPVAAESERIEKLLAEFAEYSERYQWRPFKPVVRPDVPDVKLTAWTRNPIDRFVAAQHEARGLSPQLSAAPEILLRRVYLDLIGLSPTADEVRTFAAAFETNPQAYDEVVDRLLDDPAYGERWGRHWMDVWRYSDWAGYRDALRDSQRHIWHWRDWIIESLNDDKPYDRMLVEMMAADELVPEDTDAIRATGYLARHYYANRDQWMDNVVKHTTQGFLGITVGCAKCHDHMFDPITQREYYSMRAIFERYNVRTDRVPGVLDTMKAGIPRAYDNALTTNTWFLEAGDERRPVKDEPIPAGVPTSLGGVFAVQQVSLPRLAAKPDRRDFVRQDLLAEAETTSANAKDSTAKQAADSKVAVLRAQFEIEDLEDTGGEGSDEWIAKAKDLVKLQRESAFLDAQVKVKATEAAVSKSTEDIAKAKADEDKASETKAKTSLTTAKKNVDAAKKSLAAAQKAVDADVTTKYESRNQSIYLDKSNGRRLAFARWVTAKENPLTARVAVNHIWLRHFGQGIVPTPNEFGGNGREPTHPALLDWLAAEFTDQGWSMKKLHKLIVMSTTYRMSSRVDTANSTIDPDNRFLWKMPTRRMEGELVRDNLLHISGRLDRTMGGADIDNKLAQKSVRRSVYLRHAHEKLVEFVQIFDGPSVSECYMRETSVKPHQALALANSPLTVEGSRALVAVLHKKTDGRPEQFIEEAYLTILGRQPLPEEAALCRNFLGGDSTRPTDAGRCEKLITVLFNHNDFVAIR